MTYQEIVARMGDIAVELEALRHVAEGESTPEDVERFDALTAEAADLDAKRVDVEARVAKLETVRAAAAKPEHRISGDGATVRRAPVPGATERNPFDLSGLRSAAMFGEDERVLAREVKSRAMQAIEEAPEHMEDAHRESAARLIAGNSRDAAGIAAHILRTGSPEYHEAFEDFIANPGSTRAAMSLTAANGGYLVPFTLDPTIILTNNGATNPFRGLATVKSITTDDWNGVTSAGVTAEWLAEASQAADASPTFGQPSITAHKAAAYVQASFEVLADSGVGGDIAMLIADAKDRLEATAFATGSGSGQPYGIVTELALVTASRVAGSSGAAGAADFVVADIYAVDNALPPRHRQGAAWVAEKTTYNRIRQFATGSGPQHAFWTDLGGGQPAQLIGYPTYESSAMDNTIVSGSNDDCLILGDFKAGYYIIDRVGMSLMYEPLVKGANARPTGEAGWFAYWRVGGRAVNANAFRMLRV